ncbi:MAG: GyrI-like domain-containing protein [Acidobacteriota bacterium]|nr:GyrI-like domain-containing protein [Acidobacteriota bacterium]
MQAALQEMSAGLQAQGVPPSGAWFAHHHRRPAETFDFDVCFPVATPLAPAGRVECITLPATEVVRTYYRGPYHQLPAAWPEFMQWIESNGIAVRDDIFEVYTVGPQQNPDPAQWQTEFNCPLAAGTAQ